MVTRARLTIILVALVGLVAGCMTTAPTVTLTGPPGPYLIGAPVTLTATGNPGSSAGLWTYSFSASPACGTFNPVTIGPTDQKTVTTEFTPTVETPSCTLEVTLTTASGRTAKASITRAIQGAQIVIVKDAVPDDPQDFSFSTTGGLVPANFTLDDDADPTLPNTQTFTGLAPGTYTVTEADPSPGFLLTAINCTAGGSGDVPSRTATITLTPGATVTCTFVNTKQLGTIVINKTAVGGDDTFNYTASGTGLPATFQIATSGGNGSQTFANLAGGSYTVTEQAPPTGWDFTSLVCTDPDGGTTVVGQTANIDLDPGETVTCTYTNTKRGTIVINKTAVGGDDTFGYTTSGTGGLPATFQITTSGGSGSQNFTNIIPGSHTVTEGTLPAGWSFTSLTCTDPDNGTTVVGQTANIDLDAGETVTCTYTNTFTPPALPQCPANLIAESEPNDNNASAQVLDLTPGQGTAIVSGAITPAGDLDYYQISVTDPSLVFAYVRTNIATTSTDSTLFIGVNPVTTGSSCTGSGFTECDDDDGGQGGLSSSIAGLTLSPGTYNILVKQYSNTGAPGSGYTINPYRLYVAVVPTSAVITESEPNDSPSGGQLINTCPAVISGTGGGTGASDYYRFLVPGGNTVLWTSAQQPNPGEWDSRLELWRVSTGIKIPLVGAAGSPNCNSATSGTATNPASESCSKHYEYDSADTWPNTPEDYAVNIRRSADPDTGTGGTYNLLIVVMTDVGPVPPPPPANLPAVFAYVKRGATGNDTVMRLRTTTTGVPVYTNCAAATPPDLECGDDEGATYSNTPPTGGGGGLNSAIAGHPFANIGELIFIQGYGSTTTIGPFDLYIHVPDGSLGQLTESNDAGNGTIAGAESVPALPACTQVYSEATGNQRPGFGAGGSDNVPVPLPSAGWTMEGSFASDTDVDYFGPISVTATDRVFIAIDASLDYGGAPHDHNGYSADISFSLRTTSDGIIVTIDGDTSPTGSQGALAEVVSATPGGDFYIRVAAKTGDAFKGYRLTACKF